MAENREYLTRAEENGSISIAEDVVAAIAADAVAEIEGVGSMCQNMTEQITEQFTGKKGLRGVRAEVRDGDIIIDVYLMVRYGYAIPETARKVQDSVSAAVSGMTGYSVQAVNVHVGGVTFAPAEKPAEPEEKTEPVSEAEESASEQPQDTPAEPETATE